MNYNRVLPYRPTNVMHQLQADSRVPLLNGRQVLDGYMDLRRVLGVYLAESSPMIAAVLRSAAHLRAMVGICMAPRSYAAEETKQRCLPAAFFHQVIQAAEQVSDIAPFILHVEEPAVFSAVGSDFSSVSKGFIFYYSTTTPAYPTALL